MISASIFSLFLYCFFIGTVFAEKFINKKDIISYFLNSIILSLFTSWILVFISQITETNLNYKVIFFAIVSFHLINILKKNKKITIEKNLTTLFIFLLLIIFILTNPFKHSYELVFTKYDSIVTWNQWAIDLYNFDYRGYMGYPVLFPGIWSLIYHAQDDSNFWIIAKFSTIIPVLVCLLIILKEFLRKKFQMSVYFFLSFILLFYSNPIFGDLVSGYMDVPLALFVFASLILMTSSLLDQDKSVNSIYQISFLVGLSLITKQAAIFLLIAYIVFFFIINKKIKFTLKAIISNLLIVLLPIALFLILSRESLFSLTLIENLRDVSLVESRFNFLFQSTIHMLRIYNPFILFFLLFFNLILIINFNSKNLFDIFSIFCFFIFLLIFFATSSCCSYDERNFFLTIPFLLISSFNGFRYFLSIILLEINQNKKLILKNNYLSKLSILFFLSVGILSFILSNSEEAILKLNNYKRSFIVDEIASREVVKIVEKNECTKLYSNEILLTYNSNVMKLKKRFIFNDKLNLKDIKKITSCESGNLIWFEYLSPQKIKNWNEIELYLKNNNAIRLDLNNLIFKLN